MESLMASSSLRGQGELNRAWIQIHGRRSLKPFQIDCRLSIQITGAACFLRIPAPADAIRRVHRAWEKDSCPIWRLTGGDLKLNNGPAFNLHSAPL